MIVWCSADHHFGHANIIKYCNRPFKSVTEMDGQMVERWNALVRKDDHVYYLGDFTLARRAEPYVARLNGKISFLPGSHDYWMKEDISRYEGDIWTRHEFLPALVEIKHGGHHITLCHYSMRSWPRSFHGSLHLYGHSHGRLPSWGRSMDVGVDTNNFYPYRLDDVIKLLVNEETHGD